MKLPPSIYRGVVYDSILVIVDRYTKMAKYILTTKRLTAVELADLFVKEVVSLYGSPLGIISNRGLIFTSIY